ncbi:MAG: hypothetical protein AAGE80_13180 [Pseudomonadota bacterium]
MPSGVFYDGSFVALTMADVPQRFRAFIEDETLPDRRNRLSQLNAGDRTFSDGTGPSTRPSPITAMPNLSPRDGKTKLVIREDCLMSPAASG